MKRWWLVIGLLFSLGINVGILATLAVNKVARSRGESRREALEERRPAEARAPSEVPMPRLQRLADHLEVRGEDRERFVEIQRTFFERIFAQRRALEEARRELRRELGSQDPDRARAERLLERSAAAHAELERALIDNVLDTREILEPEQQREFTRILQRIVQGPGPAERGGPPGADGAFRRGERPPFGPPNRRGDGKKKRTPP